MRKTKGIKAAQNRLPFGEYCFVSRWGDGSPCDPWNIGFLHEVGFRKDGAVRYKVGANDGTVSRWYAHCMIISAEQGERIIAEYPEFERAGVDTTIGKFLAGIAQ